MAGEKACATHTTDSATTPHTAIAFLAPFALAPFAFF